MISIFVCDRDERERELIHRDCADQVARLGNEGLAVTKAAGQETLAEAAARESPVDLLYCDFASGQSLAGLISFRRQYRQAMVMLITDLSVSPREYLRPGVAPDSLLLRPIDGALPQVNQEFVEAYLRRGREDTAEESFVLETREERTYIPYSRIYYFEARDKKLYLRTRNEELGFYGTIEALAGKLPDNFVRSHRSYIVNTDKITRILTAEGYIEMTDNIGAPVSRGFRANLLGKRS